MTNVTEVRENLKSAAVAHKQQYPQYRGHFDNYILVRARKDVKTKLGCAFAKDEMAIAFPKICEQTRTTPSGRVKKYQTIVVYSMLRRCDIDVLLDEFQILEPVKLG